MCKNIPRIPYAEPYILYGDRGNNALSWEIRKNLSGKEPTLIVPMRRYGTWRDVRLGSAIVFEEISDESIISCTGLEYFITCEQNTHNSIGYTPYSIFDNHNHALYFWIEAIHHGWITPGFELIHIDEHSDLWENPHILDLQKSLEDLIYTWDYVNHSCNVGNYIIPALNSSLVDTLTRIENEYQLDQYHDYIPRKNSVLNIDLDFFAPELDHIPNMKKLALIRHLMQHVSFITIATSPYFIDPERALAYLEKIFEG